MKVDLRSNPRADKEGYSDVYAKSESQDDGRGCFDVVGIKDAKLDSRADLSSRNTLSCEARRLGRSKGR